MATGGLVSTKQQIRIWKSGPAGFASITQTCRILQNSSTAEKDLSGLDCSGQLLLEALINNESVCAYVLILRMTGISNLLLPFFDLGHSCLSSLLGIASPIHLLVLQLLQLHTLEQPHIDDARAVKKPWANTACHTRAAARGAEVVSNRVRCERVALSSDQ